MNKFHIRSISIIVLLLSAFMALGIIFAPRKDIKEGEEEDMAVVGADRIDIILQIVRDKRVGLIVNQTSVLHNGTHLLDTLLKKNVKVVKVFAPEHGFRGMEEAGEAVKNAIDSKTGVPVTSIYGSNNKPTAAQLADIDMLIFDIQDVGARFYTYISTMHFSMEACAENGKEFIVLDRPNPNDFIDGPIRKEGFSSFVSVDPIPVLHGLTVGELACMINGEGWITTGKHSCKLKVVLMDNWAHGVPHHVSINPSPNLPNNTAIRLYPSLCFFEGTNISVGRGTTFPFQVLGNPNEKYGTFTFTPQPIRGMDSNPMHNGKTCYGIDLRDNTFEGGLSLKYVMDFFEKSGYNEKDFFTRARFFDLLAGTDQLRLQIINRLSEDEIRSSWQQELNDYRIMRKKYIFYDEPL